MTSRRAAVLVRATGTVLVAFLALLMTPQAASACDVSYHYKPSFSLDRPEGGRGTVCSNSTSLTGSALVALGAMSALAAAGVVAFRRGEATAASLAGPARLRPWSIAEGAE